MTHIYGSLRNTATDSYGSGQKPVVGAWECGDQPLGSINGGEFD